MGGQNVVMDLLVGCLYLCEVVILRVTASRKRHCQSSASNDDNNHDREATKRNRDEDDEGS